MDKEGITALQWRHPLQLCYSDVKVLRRLSILFTVEIALNWACIQPEGNKLSLNSSQNNVWFFGGLSAVFLCQSCIVSSAVIDGRCGSCKTTAYCDPTASPYSFFTKRNCSEIQYSPLPMGLRAYCHCSFVFLCPSVHWGWDRGWRTPMKPEVRRECWIPASLHD